MPPSRKLPLSSDALPDGIDFSARVPPGLLFWGVISQHLGK